MAQSIARSSKKLPSSGCGACRSGSPARLSQIEPSTARPKPIQVIRPIRSCSNNQAPTATSNGSSAVIIPAWAALVYCRAKDSQRKYRQGSQTARPSRYFQSPGR